ncbi:HAD-IIB family hydrolase [Bacillaceae bacterium SIJ1]|uniref:HAD-IIB family hydrolase n=1 Tax=Litoribacterium kuwaitense TaxID=1398745 RepID=UPI0013EB97D0|nr:HAD-IIB family hydrolase [Litoribacterium kuwaitense]NGP46418.1 HAD-IIB family hydrolase [Litoribacterium kuwaitense]
MTFVFDIDGTICFQGKPLTAGIIEALEHCTKQGHRVIFASARPIRDLLPVLPKKMHTYEMVGGNGAFIAKDGLIETPYFFDEHTVKTIRALIGQYELAYLLDSHWDYSYTGSHEHPIYRKIDPHKLANNVPLEKLSEIVKMVLFPGAYEDQILPVLKELPVHVYQHGEEQIIDISPQGVDKWQGLKALGVEKNGYIAFGNDANDISMFTHAREGVCVGDHEALRAVATVHVSCHEEAVVAAILERAHASKALR